MELNHFIQNLRIQLFILHIGIPSTTRLLHGEGHVVTEAYVGAIVETAAGAVGAMSLLEE
jgi:hypothetical protein